MAPNAPPKENGNYRNYRAFIGIIGYILGLYWDNGKREWKLLLRFLEVHGSVMWGFGGLLGLDRWVLG